MLLLGLEDYVIEYWSLSVHGVQDVTYWRLWGRDVVSGCRGFVGLGFCLCFLGVLGGGMLRSSFGNGGKSLNKEWTVSGMLLQLLAE